MKQEVHLVFKRFFIPTVCGLVSLSGSSLSADFNSCCMPAPCGMPYYDSCNAPCGSRWSGGIDFLYWKPTQEGLFLGADVSGTVNLRFTNQNVLTEEVQPLELKYKWEGGFRVWAGFSPNASSWSFDVAYTHFATNVHTDFNEIDSNASFISPFFTQSSGGALFTTSALDPTSLSNEWHLNFNLFDFTFSKECCLCSGVHFRPFAGLRVLYVHEKLEQTFTSGINIAEFGAPFASSNRQDYTAVGPVVGFEAAWNIGCGLELYGGADVALVYGKSKVSQEQNRFEVAGRLDPIVQELNSTTQFSYYNDVLNVDLAIGFRWNTTFNNDAQNFMVRFGWEEHLYSDINQWASEAVFFDNVNFTQGDLYLRGFILGANVTF